LWVINWVHTQLQLGLVGIPTLRAHKQVINLGLLNLFFQRRQFVLEATPIAATLTTTITATSTSIVLNDVTGLPATGFIKIDDEIINYSYITQNTNAKTGTLFNCFRGQQETIAVGHTAAAVVYWAQVPAVTVWPTPDGSQTYTFVYWRLRRTQDAGGGVNVMDIPFRFIPCLAAGLAYYLALKIVGGAERLPVLKQQYDEAWELAATEDREKAAIRFVPRQQFIGGGT